MWIGWKTEKYTEVIRRFLAVEIDGYKLRTVLLKTWELFATMRQCERDMNSRWI